MVVWGAGVVLMAIGFLAERSSSPNAAAGGDGLMFYAFGTLAILVGLCWSLAAAIAALVRRARSTDSRPGAQSVLAINAVPLCGTAGLIGLVWLTNLS